MSLKFQASVPAQLLIVLTMPVEPMRGRVLRDRGGASDAFVVVLVVASFLVPLCALLVLLSALVVLPCAFVVVPCAVLFVGVSGACSGRPPGCSVMALSFRDRGDS